MNNWPQLVEQAQLMVMMLDSNPVPSTFAESVTAEFVNVYGDYCSTQRSMLDTLVKVSFFFNFCNFYSQNGLLDCAKITTLVLCSRNMASLTKF